MAEAEGADDRVGGEVGFKIGQLAHSAAQDELAVRGDDGHAGGVIATVFHAVQALDTDVRGLTLTDIPNNSTHADRLDSRSKP